MPVSTFAGGEVFRGGVSLGRISRLLRGGAEIWTRPAAGNAIPGTLRNPPFGMVLHWPSANEASHSPFLNRLKIATEWRSSPQSGNTQMAWADLVAGEHITSTGTINNIPAGHDNLVMDALGYMPAESGASGRYRLFYSSTSPDAGNNIWIMGGASNTDNSVPGQIDFDYTANGAAVATILIVGVPAPITLRALVKHDHLTNYAAGEVFDPLWLDVIRNNRVLRFGDWQRVDRYTGSAAWADRTPVDRVTYDGAAGVPFEHWFAVCNLVGADPWINILSPADDTYCANLAAMARAQLGPGRRIYVELSNKVWDSTNWVTADHFRALAVAQFGDNSVEACMEAYGGRSAQVFAIWRAEWAGADAARLRTVLQGWTGVAHHDSYIMDAPRWVAAASGRVAPWTLATDFALQNVLDGGLRYDWMPENLAVLDGWFADLASAAMTEQDLIEEFASALRGTNPAVSGGYDIASLGANYDAHLTYLATRPLNVIAYEGGSHLCVPPSRTGNAAWRDFYRTFHRSPEGAAVFGDARAAFHAKFPSAETVYAYRCDVRKPDQNQSEGLYFHLGDTTGNNPLTRWLADQAARQGAPGRGDEAFVGTMERQSAAPNGGVGAAAPIMLVGNSLPIGLSSMWWGSTDGTTDGNTQHSVAVQFRADYAGPITRGIGDGTQIGPQITTQMLWDRPEGDWAANNDPRRDLAAYAGGAMMLYEGYRHGAISLARPYFDWLGNEHRIEVALDLDYEMRFVRAAAQAGVAVYLGGTWPPLIENPPNDAAWRPLVDAFDEALRYRRDVLSARLRAEGLPDAVWIVPTHLMFGRFYDDDQAGMLPSGLTSHRDMHALDTNGHAGGIGAGNHPYMVNPLSAYCAWCMIREVVMGEDASAMAPWTADGVTADLAAYLRGVAVDIVRNYAPAGRGGAQRSDPGYIEPVPAAPQAALAATFAASWIDGAVATATPPGPLDYGGFIISATDLSALANTHVELGRITGPAGRHVILQAWDWGGGDQVEVSFHAADGSRQVGVQIQLPGPGNWLMEWRNLPTGLTMRRVNLDAPASAADKVATSVSWPPEYAVDLPAGASTVVVTPPAYIDLQAVWAGTQIPDAVQMVGLNAWVDDLTGLMAWD